MSNHRWAVHTNRHCTCDGYLWGWAEGPGPRFYWENGTPRNQDWARARVKELNDSLEKELSKDGETRGCDCDTPTTVHDVACPMKGGES